MHSHFRRLRLGLGLAQHPRLHPRHQEALNRLPRQPGPTPLRRPHRRHRRLGVRAPTIRARFDGVLDGDLAVIDFGEAALPRGGQVRLQSYLSCTSHWRAAALPSLAFPSCRETGFNWQEEQEKGYVLLRC